MISLLFSLQKPIARMMIVVSLGLLWLFAIDAWQVNGAISIEGAVETASSAPAHRWGIRASDLVTIVYSQPPSGTLFRQSSQLGYDRMSSDYDQYVWDDFILSTTHVITEIDWRGEYLYNGSYGPITDFVVSIYTSTAAGWQPDVINPPLVEYIAGNTANENPPWAAGQPIATFHNYQFMLPTPFTIEAGLKYWVQIEGIQPGPTDWGVVGGGYGSGVLFYAIPGVGDFQYFRAPGDIAFTLAGPPVTPTVIFNHWIYLPILLN